MMMDCFIIYTRDMVNVNTITSLGLRVPKERGYIPWSPMSEVSLCPGPF
jgi:hypothetical protein